MREMRMSQTKQKRTGEANGLCASPARSFETDLWQKDVVARTPIEKILAAAADQDIIACAAEQGVVPAAADEDIIAIAAVGCELNAGSDQTRCFDHIAATTECLDRQA